MLSVEHLNGVVVHCQGDRLQRHVNLREMSVTQLTKHFCLKLVNSFSLMVREFLAIDYLGTAQPVLNSIQRHRTAQNGGKEAAEEGLEGEWSRLVSGLENGVLQQNLVGAAGFRNIHIFDPQVSTGVETKGFHGVALLLI